MTMLAASKLIISSSTWYFPFAMISSRRQMSKKSNLVVSSKCTVNLADDGGKSMRYRLKTDASAVRIKQSLKTRKLPVIFWLARRH